MKLLAVTTIWYLVITPLPVDKHPAGAFKSFEIETAEFANKADCDAYAKAHMAKHLSERHYPAEIVGVPACFSREK